MRAGATFNKLRCARAPRLPPLARRPRPRWAPRPSCPRCPTVRSLTVVVVVDSARAVRVSGCGEMCVVGGGGLATPGRWGRRRRRARSWAGPKRASMRASCWRCLCKSLRACPAPERGGSCYSGGRGAARGCRAVIVCVDANAGKISRRECQANRQGCMHVYMSICERTWAGAARVFSTA